MQIINVLIVKQNALTVSFQVESREQAYTEIVRMRKDGHFYGLTEADPVFMSDGTGLQRYTVADVLGWLTVTRTRIAPVEHRPLGALRCPECHYEMGKHSTKCPQG